MNVWIFLLVATGIIGLFVVASRLEAGRLSAPQKFDYEGETFFWVRDPDAPRPFGSAVHEYGGFCYADGTPVTDFRLDRMLQAHWLALNERREVSPGGLS